MSSKIRPIPGGKRAAERCTHPTHEPPHHIVIPPGHELVHKCDGCGRTVVIRSSSPVYVAPPTQEPSSPWPPDPTDPRSPYGSGPAYVGGPSDDSSVWHPPGLSDPRTRAWWW